MTEKELHRLRRQDLLQLLLSQGKEALAIQTKLNNVNGALIQLKGGYQRLKDKLNEKDALIEKLKNRLDAKDARIKELENEIEAIRLSRRIQLEEAGSIAEAALALNGVFEAAQKAADQYLYNLQRMCDHKAERLLERTEEDPGWEKEFFSLDEEEAFSDLEEEEGFPALSEEEEPRNADE